MNGIWDYNKIFKHKIQSEFQLSLGEGGTPISSSETLSKKFRVESLKFKREDLNPNSSFKDRSLAFQISYYYQKGVTELVLSSSGNSAISALAYCSLAKIKLHVFISKKIPEYKLKRFLGILELNNKNKKKFVKKENFECGLFQLYFSKTPKSDAIKFTNDKGIKNIVGSKDDTGIEGYKTIAFELIEKAPDIDSIFMPCSSGTSTVGIFEGFRKAKAEIPKIFIVQTTKVHPIAKLFDDNFEKSSKSDASAIVDRVADRKDQIVEIISKTKGGGVVVSDDEISESINLLKRFVDIEVSPDGAIGLAGLMKLVNSNRREFSNPCVIISGK